ncbi:hypothetical protein L6452_02243 [Arctium lappa]|uniref:Uncharacterized protein n=1 Tax=Arctium lappa TaxID=4217 RepID=A0ACB9FIK3_ARCLA|nr:hypothetical protein L6452_02243 [Arctium lappa]
MDINAGTDTSDILYDSKSQSIIITDPQLFFLSFSLSLSLFPPPFIFPSVTPTPPHSTFEFLSSVTLI